MYAGSCEYMNQYSWICLEAYVKMLPTKEIGFEKLIGCSKDLSYLLCMSYSLCRIIMLG